MEWVTVRIQGKSYLYLQSRSGTGTSGGEHRNFRWNFRSPGNDRWARSTGSGEWAKNMPTGTSGIPPELPVRTGTSGRRPVLPVGSIFAKPALRCAARNSCLPVLPVFHRNFRWTPELPVESRYYRQLTNPRQTALRCAARNSCLPVDRKSVV